MPTLRTVATGLCFPEGPRWHRGRLWFSDMHDRTVRRLEPDGALTAMAEVPNRPSGLGFLPDGTPLVVSMRDRQLLALRGEVAELHADLSALAAHDLNDMVVDRRGRAYVGNFGGPDPPPAPAVPTTLQMVAPDGAVTTVAQDLRFPNGLVLTADGRTLIVAESRSIPSRLTRFAIAADGSLSAREVLITFGADDLADGLAIDSQDRVWAALPFTDRLRRVTPVGEVDLEVAIPNPYALSIGASDRELFVCCAPDWEESAARVARRGRIVRVGI